MSADDRRGREGISGKKAESKDGDDFDAPGSGENSGTMIADATCAPSNIRYSQDVSLLNETRENFWRFSMIPQTEKHLVFIMSVPERIT